MQPEGFVHCQNQDKVCRPHKALYGLKQAPRVWIFMLHHTLLSFDFISAKSDHSLCIKFRDKTEIFNLVYVDDILITGNNGLRSTSISSP